MIAIVELSIDQGKEAAQPTKGPTAKRLNSSAQGRRAAAHPGLPSHSRQYAESVIQWLDAAPVFVLRLRRKTRSSQSPRGCPVLTALWN
jgi:hypothetical protein